MANQVGANLTCLTTTYYNTVHASQLHNDYKRAVTQTYGSDLLTSWMDMNSTQTRRAASTFYHLEWDRLNTPITTTGGSGAAGAAVTLTINSGYIASGAYDPVAVGYSVFDGTYTYYVSAKNDTVANTHTMTLVPPTAAVAISIASGQSLMILPIVQVGEGSCVTPNSIRGDGVVFSNTLQPVRRDFCITDIAALSFSESVTFWDLLNPLTGRSDKVWFHSELGRTEVEFRNAMEVAFLTGLQLTNTTLTTLGLQGTTGVIPSIKAYGNTKSYAQGVGFQISDFKDMQLVMTKNQSSKEYIWSGGAELNMQVQDLIKEYFPNGAVTYGAFGGSMDNALKWGFTSIGFNNRTIHFQNNEIFNNPSWLGNSAFNYIRSAIVMPAGKMSNAAGEQVNYIEKVVLAGNGLDGGYQHYLRDGTGFFSDTHIPDCRTATWTWWTTMGAEIFAAKQLFYVQPALS